MSPALSICIPVFNGVHFVREAVESALAQTYEPLEVLVFDNVSTDGTTDILAGIEDARLKVQLSTEHVSMAANWNRAAAAAAHDHVLMLSADDRLLPGAAERLMEPFRHPAATPDLVFGIAVHEPTGGRRDAGQPGTRWQPGPLNDPERFVVENALPINVNATVFRREWLKMAEDVGVVCDLDLFIRLARAGRVFHALAAPVTEYREHGEALSADRERMWRESLEVYRRHSLGNPRQNLYRRRIFLTVVWLVAFLAARGEREKIPAYLERCRASLGPARRVFLWWISHVPGTFRILAALRQLRFPATATS